MIRSFGVKFFTAINYAVLTIFALVTLLPFLYVILVSFTDPTEYMSKSIVLFPQTWSLSAYEFIFSTNAFLKAMGVSGFLAVFGTLLSLIVTSALAYVLSRKRLKGKKFFLVAILLTMLFNPGMIPNYLLVDTLGLMDTVWALILPALTSAWYVFLMKNFYQEIPDELEEAAKIDGCSDIGVFIRIMLPVSVSALAAFGLFYAVAYWNTYFSGVLYINTDTLRPLQVLLQMMLVSASQMADPSIAAMLESEQTVPPQVIKMAAVVVSSLPIVIVYPFLQKYFVKGMMVGSVKG